MNRADNRATVEPAGYGRITDHRDQRAVLRRIIHAYDGVIVRAYCYIRFIIININMLHILSLCLQRKGRVLEIGCGFGLFGCYFASRWPQITYHGLDLDEGRIRMARKAAERLELDNVRFDCGDAAKPLDVDGKYDAILMMDLLHHIPDDAKRRLLDSVTRMLNPGGHLIIKDITRRPFWKMGFTWLLDVLMTRSFDMWYWDPESFRGAVDPALDVETYPISDWLPYPHIVYLFRKPGRI